MKSEINLILKYN